MLAYKHKAFTMAAKKISPLYANLIDYLDTYNASVYKHHKTDNKIYIWVKQTIFNYNFAADVKTATYTYFKDLIIAKKALTNDDINNIYKQLSINKINTYSHDIIENNI